MRSTRRKRPRRRVISVPANTDLERLAVRVVYEGSPEHKDVPSFAGPPRLRADASCCPRYIRDREIVTEWLRSAIRRGATGGPWEGGFPRYVWYENDGTVFEGRLVNRGQGAYKGYPLYEDEWPGGIEELYGGA